VLAAPALAALLAPPVAIGIALVGAPGSLGRARAIAVLVTALAIVAASVVANADLLSFFARRRGLWFAARAWLFHQVHLLLGAAAFLVSWLRRPRLL